MPEKKRALWLDTIKLIALLAALVAVFTPYGCDMVPHNHPHSLESLK